MTELSKHPAWIRKGQTPTGKKESEGVPTMTHSTSVGSGEVPIRGKRHPASAAHGIKGDCKG